MYFFPHVCCICNKTNCEFKNVKKKDEDGRIIDKILKCVPEVKNLISPCSENICTNCYIKLNDLYKFKSSCIKTHRILFDYAKELDANDNQNSQLQVEVELTVKNEPVNLENDLVTVYHVQVVKELEENEGNSTETDLDNLRNDINQAVETIFSNFSFEGFSNEDIQTSNEATNKLAETITVLTPKDDFDDHLTCRYCQRIFILAANCRQHEKKHLNNKSNFCLICMQVIGPHIELKDHIRSHFKTLFEKSCDLCTETFNSDSELSYHRTMMHSKLSYTCDVCKKRFEKKLALTKHINTHFRTDKDLIPCSQCDKKFINRSNYNRHFQLIHEKLKPFKCHLCPKAFGMKHNLKKHLDCHSGVKRYQCSLCEKCFRYEVSLTNHFVLHSRHKCPLCDESFLTFKELRDHERQHRTDLPYHCNFCGKNFKLASHLSNHISHKHENDIKPFLP